MIVSVELYTNAVNFIQGKTNIGVSCLQRELGICYIMASNLMDMLEQAEHVGPQVACQKREVKKPGKEQ